MPHPRNSWIVFLAFSSLASASDDASLFDAIRNNNQPQVISLLARGASPNGANAQGATPLMWAAVHAGMDVMKALLEKGADPNAANPAGATPLMWAGGNFAKAHLLVSRGANVNAQAKSGRTPLIIAATTPGNIQTVKFLLSKGADPKIADQSGDGPLGSASSAADVEMMKALIAAGAKVEERGNRGPAMQAVTPLMRAANANCLECVRLLLAHGADVNAVSAGARNVKAGLQSLGNLTPLLMAAPWSNPEIVTLLADAGANLEARDFRGFTPLMLAITNEHQEPRTVQLLLKRGAKADVVTQERESALSWAAKWGENSKIARMLGEHGGKPDEVKRYVPPPVEPSKRTAAEAVAKSAALIQASNVTFFQKSGCVGCHHQMLAGMMLGAARDRGISIDEKLASENLKTALTVNRPFREAALQRIAAGGAPFANALFLISLAAQKHPADDLTDALVHDIAGMQRPDGYWQGMAQRPPMEYDNIGETAMSLRALRLYASPGRKQEIDGIVAKSQGWLMKAKPLTIEETVMKLLGLLWSGAKPEAALAKSLLNAQRDDGGWAQRPGFPSDAYATGQVLYALNQAGGVPTSSPAFRKGVEYLLRTQYPDGSWHVRSRSVKFQPYFESGFPHEHDQWISAAGTCWAAIALTL